MYVANWEEANNSLHNVTGSNHIYGLCDTGKSAFAFTTLDALSGEGMGYFVCPCENGQGQAHKGKYIYIDPIRTRLIKTIEQYHSDHGQSTTIIVSKSSNDTTLTVAILIDTQYFMPTDLLTVSNEYQSAFQSYETLARQTLANLGNSTSST